MTRPELWEQIYTVVSEVPAGRITTYGRVAQMTEGATARMVGTAMRKLPAESTLPWHRVVAASRKLADHGGADRQRERLAAEGVVFDQAGRIPARLLWPDPASGSDRDPGAERGG